MPSKAQKASFFLCLFLGIAAYIYNYVATSAGNGAQELPNADTAKEAAEMLKPDIGNVSQARYVYISAFARGGSTFLGDIFNQHPAVFYWFEPLAGIYEAAANSETHVYDNGTIRHFNASLINLMRVNLENIFSCRLFDLSPSILRHRFVSSKTWDMSRKLHVYKHCIRKRSNAECLRDLQDACRRSTTRVVKEIRLDLSDAEPLIASHENLRIIFETRDPRGILQSRWFAAKTKPKFPKQPRTLCRQMANDFEAFKRLQDKYPRVLLWIQYEDLAAQPRSFLRRLYDFVGLRPTEDVRKWIYKATHAQNDGNTMSTKKRNSNETAQKWRKRLTKYQVEEINKECQNLLETLGYKV